MTLLGDRLRSYGREFAFAAGLETGLGQRLNLMRVTAAYHLRNWRKAPPGRDGQLKVTFGYRGADIAIALRPGDTDLSIFYEIFALELYRIGDDVLSPADVQTVIDAGAHVGLAALYFAARYPAARIVSVEPNPDNFALLKANTAREPRIVPVNAALAAEPGEVFIETSGRSAQLRSNSEGRGVGVRGITIEDLCGEHGIEHIDLLKIDIEGAEQAVFAEARFLPRVRAIIGELHADYGIPEFNRDIALEGLVAAESEHARQTQQGLVVLATRR